MADSDINVNIRTQGDPSGANVVTQAIEKLEKEAPQAATAVKQLQTAVERAETQHRQTGVSIERLAEGMRRTEGSTRNTNQAILTFGRGIQDLQGGIAGVLNNIEAMVMTLGGTAGLAGILTLVGTGLYFLTRNLDIFGTAAEEAAKKAEELRESTDKTAEASRRHAEQVKAEEAATRRYEERLRAINERFKEQTAEIERNTAALHRKMVAEQQLADARTAGALAEVDVDEATGKIGPGEAVVKRREIERQAAQEKMERQQKEDQQRAAAEADKANAARAEAATKEAEADRLRRTSRGALDKDQRKALEDKRAALDAEAKEKQAKAEEMAPTIREYGEGGGLLGREVPNQERVAKEAEVKEVQTRIREINDKLNADDSARRQGGKSLKELEADIEKLKLQAREAEKKAEEALRRRDEIKEGIENRAQLFPVTEEAKDKQADARLQGIKRREEEKAAKELERESKFDSANARGTEKIADTAAGLGANPKVVAQLRILAQRTRSGDDNADDEILQLLRLLVSTKAADTKEMLKMKEEIRKLADQIKNSRSGN